MTFVGRQLFVFSERYFAEIPILTYISIHAAITPQGSIKRIFTYLSLKHILLFLFLFSLAILGYFRTDNFTSTYGNFRAILFFAIVYFTTFDVKHKYDDAKSFILVSCVFAALLNALTVDYYVQGTYAEFYEGKTPIPVLSAIVAVLITASNGQFLAFSFLSALSIYLSLKSGYRNTILSSAFFIIPAILTFLKSEPIRNINPIIKATSAFALFAICAAPISLIFSNTLENNQTFTNDILQRSENFYDFINGNSFLNKSDSQRLDYYIDIINHTDEYILPHGIGSKSFEFADQKRFTLGQIMTNDSAIYFTIFHFSIIVFTAIVIYSTATIFIDLKNAKSFSYASIYLLSASGLVLYTATNSAMLVELCRIPEFIFCIFTIRYLLKP